MERLTMPDASVVVGKCQRCGAEMTIADHWYLFFKKLMNAVNGML